MFSVDNSVGNQVLIQILKKNPSPIILDLAQLLWRGLFFQQQKSQ